jgi:hypothetical protein
VLLPYRNELGKPDKQILLIMDGASSHTGESRIDMVDRSKFLEDHKITVLVLPAHTTHILQPLDVGLFNVFKSSLRSSQTARAVKWIADVSGMSGATKKRTIALAKSIAACTFAMRPQTLMGSFIKTGIYPSSLLTFIKHTSLVRGVPPEVMEEVQVHHASIGELRKLHLVPKQRIKVTGKVKVFG